MVGAMPYTRALVHNEPWPELFGARCADEDGRNIMDATRYANVAAGAFARAISLCERCPVIANCEKTLKWEKPAGSWGGVLAGMTPQDRRKR